MTRYSGRIEQFYVPSAFIKPFARMMQRYQLENNISGVENDDLEIFVSYEASKQSIIDLIHLKIEKYITYTAYAGPVSIIFIHFYSPTKADLHEDFIRYIIF